MQALHDSSDDSVEWLTWEIHDPLLKKPVVFHYKDSAAWLMREYGNVEYKGKFDAFAAKVPHLPRHHMEPRRYSMHLEVALNFTQNRPALTYLRQSMGYRSMKLEHPAAACS